MTRTFTPTNEHDTRCACGLDVAEHPGGRCPASVTAEGARAELEADGIDVEADTAEALEVVRQARAKAGLVATPKEAAAHVDDCAECRSFVAQAAERLAASYQGLPGEPPPTPRVASGVAGAVDPELERVKGILLAGLEEGKRRRAAKQAQPAPLVDPDGDRYRADLELLGRTGAEQDFVGECLADPALARAAAEEFKLDLATPEVLRSLSDADLAKVRPVSDEALESALAAGRAEAAAFRGEPFATAAANSTAPALDLEGLAALVKDLPRGHRRDQLAPRGVAVIFPSEAARAGFIDAAMARFGISEEEALRAVVALVWAENAERAKAEGKPPPGPAPTGTPRAQVMPAAAGQPDAIYVVDLDAEEG
jgi:hypothetical protein